MPKNNINHERLPDGSTPLHNEVRAGNAKTIKLLIRQGTNFNIKDAQGKTPLDYAPTEEIRKILITAMQVDQILIYSKADKYFNYLKNTYIKTESDKDKAIDILFSDPTIEPDVIEVVMQKVLNYNVNGSSSAATPAVIAPVEEPVAPPVAPTATTIIPSAASMEALNAIKARLINDDSIEDIISSLDHYDIENEIKDILIQHVYNYVSDNNSVAAPAIEASTTTTATSVFSSEGKLSADIKVRLYNGESKEDLIDFVLLYQGINEDARNDLVSYIFDYAPATELAGNVQDTHI